MDGIETLRQRYPWPAECPQVPARMHTDDMPDGWCCGQNVRMFNRLLGHESKVVVELGSWLGRSTTALLQAAPTALLLCIDHWKGSAEHQQRPEWKAQLPTLHETFQRNMWGYRQRIVPMKTTTIEGMQEIYRLGVAPDLVYVDASHDPISVESDVSTALRLFPDAQICGDDWTFETVRQGVRQAIEGRPLRIVSDLVCWHLEPAA